MQLVALAVGPAFLLLHVFYATDRKREPWANILKYCVLGALAVFVAGAIEGALIDAADAASGGWIEHSSFGLWFKAFVLVALVEELCKLGPVVLFGAFDKHLDEPFDWIVYSVASALGFAAVENLYYVAEGGVGTALARAFTAVPGHALDGTLMGYHLARASTSHGAERARQRILALVEPVAWHGAYDGLLFLTNEARAHGVSTGLWTCAWFALVATQWSVCVRRICCTRDLLPAKPPPMLMPMTAAQRIARWRRERGRG